MEKQESAYYRPFLYKGVKFTLAEQSFKDIVGVKARFDGMNFLVINIKQSQQIKSKMLHRLVKSKKDYLLKKALCKGHKKNL